MSLIRLTDVGVALGGRPILRDVDLGVEQGEVVALLGPNGSGKSTLVKTMLGLIPTSRGEVSLFDTPLRGFTEWSRVGYVPQRNLTPSGVPATVREIVSTGRLSRRGPFRPASRADRDAVDHALDVVGLSSRASSQVSTLSGGQVQRVLMARALADEPELLVLDEPNAGVDLPSQARIAEALAVLIERGATVVVVLHELGQLRPLITRSVVMDEGRVAHDGPAVEVVGHDHAHHDATYDVPWSGMAAPLEGGD